MKIRKEHSAIAARDDESQAYFRSSRLPKHWGQLSLMAFLLDYLNIW